MQVLYMYMPELPRTRHVIVGDRHIINTAAPESRIYYKVKQRERKGMERKSPALRQGENYLVGE